MRSTVQNTLPRSVTNTFYMNKTLNYASKSIVVADKAKLFTVSVNKNVKHFKQKKKKNDDGLSLIKKK